MKCNGKAAAWTTGLVALLALVVHFGPPAAWIRRDRILSAVTATNGATLCVVAHRTGHPIDAYEVNLYRIERNGDTFRYYLGNEESYWWGCSLGTVGQPAQVEIRCFWHPVAAYSFEADEVMWLDSKTSRSVAVRCGVGNLSLPLARYKK